MLLAQGTRGDKSAVLQTVSAITCSVTLITENTLSLSANQYSKIKEVNIAHGPIKAFHLDSTPAKRNQEKLLNLLKNLLSDTEATVFLFLHPNFF